MTGSPSEALPVVILACQVLENILERLLPQGLAAQVRFMDYGLHRVPGKMAWTLQEIVDSERGVEALRESWEQTKAEFRTGSKREGMRKLFRSLRDYFDVKARYQRARQLLEEHKDNIYDVLSRDDPQAALGVLYPLAVFLRHGKVNLELITGEGGPGSDDGK